MINIPRSSGSWTAPASFKHTRCLRKYCPLRH